MSSPETPNASAPDAADLHTRQLLDRIVRGAGYGWRDVEQHLRERTGPAEGPPLGNLLRDLHVMDLERDNFFEVLIPRFDRARFELPIEREVADLLQEFGAPELPAEGALGPEDRTLASTLDRIDRRVLDLIERTLGEPANPAASKQPKPLAAPDNPAPGDGGAGRPA